MVSKTDYIWFIPDPRSIKIYWFSALFLTRASYILIGKNSYLSLYYTCPGIESNI